MNTNTATNVEPEQWGRWYVEACHSIGIDDDDKKLHELLSQDEINEIFMIAMRSENGDDMKEKFAIWNSNRSKV